MTKQLVAIDTANDTFQVWIDRFNEVITVVNTEVVTVNATSGISTGNGFVNGFFGANTLVATNLRGGNVDSASILTITSNTLIDSSELSVGNSTVNVNILGSNVTLSNVDVTYTLALPNTVQKAANNYFLNANGQWSIVNVATVSVGGSNTAIQFNNSGAFGASDSFTFNNTSNTVAVGNSTVNVNITTSTVRVINSTANVTLTPTLISVGNSTSNSRMNSTTVLATNGVFSVSVNTATVLVSNGSAAAPTYSFFSDPDSGFYSSGTNQVTLSLEGVNRVTFNTANTIFASNTVTFGTGVYFIANGNLGLGNTAPAYKLRVQGDISLSGGIHANGTFGTAGQILFTDGLVSYWANSTGAVLTANNTDTQTFYLPMANSTSGSWANGVVANTKLYFVPSTGTLNATIFNSLSDQSKKTDIVTIQSALDKVIGMRGVEFKWSDNGEKSSGVIAQEVELIAPHLVKTDNAGTKSVHYDGLIPYLLEAIKELNEKVKRLENG